jgi:hypothetical protein
MTTLVQQDDDRFYFAYYACTDQFMCPYIRTHTTGSIPNYEFIKCPFLHSINDHLLIIAPEVLAKSHEHNIRVSVDKIQFLSSVVRRKAVLIIAT